mmetsp:Transcript_19843/g.55169  ORF Transcript_19843/g.55169 Transcript_19843/m.55169 type:complete len:305 (+) Transcript_19843:2756-3670(+)
MSLQNAEVTNLSTQDAWERADIRTENKAANWSIAAQEVVISGVQIPSKMVVDVYVMDSVREPNESNNKHDLRCKLRKRLDTLHTESYENWRRGLERDPRLKDNVRALLEEGRCPRDSWTNVLKDLQPRSENPPVTPNDIPAASVRANAAMHSQRGRRDPHPRVAVGPLCMGAKRPAAQEEHGTTTKKKAKLGSELKLRPSDNSQRLGNGRGSTSGSEQRHRSSGSGKPCHKLCGKATQKPTHSAAFRPAAQPGSRLGGAPIQRRTGNGKPQGTLEATVSDTMAGPRSNSENFFGAAPIARRHPV